MEIDELKVEEKNLTYIYSLMSPVELSEEYDAYVSDKEFGILYDVLIREISSRSQDSPTYWVGKVKKYNKFLIKSDKLGLNPNAISQHLDEKGRVLEDILGYVKLKGDERTIRTLVARGDVKLGIAFQSIHSTAQKALKIEEIS